MATRTCWSCGSLAHMTLIGEAQVRDEYDPFRLDQSLVQGFYTCDQCSRASVGITIVASERLRYSSAIEVLDAECKQETLGWLPLQAVSKDFPDVPEHIAGAASEAHICRSVESFRAAILLARAGVEATAKHRKIIKGTLESKIDAMYDANLISELIRDSAHEIRHIGNDMAHGDFLADITAQDADETLALMDMVLDEVFQKPAKVQRLREAREARKDGLRLQSG